MNPTKQSPVTCENLLLDAWHAIWGGGGPASKDLNVLSGAVCLQRSNVPDEQRMEISESELEWYMAFCSVFHAIFTK